MQDLRRLRHDATRCRELASTAVTPEAREVLTGLALRYEQKAAALERSDAARKGSRPAFEWALG